MVRKFLIFELSPSTKKLGKTEIENGIRVNLIRGNRKSKNFRNFGDVEGLVNTLEIYLPFRELKLGRYQPKQKDYYISGYAFLEFNNLLSYSCIEGTTYVDYLLRSTSSNIPYELMDEDTIRVEQNKMYRYFNSVYLPGQLLKVINGSFCNMFARILQVSSDASVYSCAIVSKSNSWILDMPASYLSVLECDLLVDDGDILDDELEK